MKIDVILNIIESIINDKIIDLNSIGECEYNILKYHKLDTMLYNRLDKTDFNKKKFLKYLEQSHNENVQKFKMYTRISQELFEAFSLEKIPFISLKGLAIASSVYTYIGDRYFHDIDFLVNISDLPKIEKIMLENGFVFGTVNKETLEIIPASRKSIIERKLNTHEIAQLVRREENGRVSFVDINFCFQWKGFNNEQIPFSTLMNHVIPINEKNSILTFEPIFMFLHLACHFFNESTRFVFSHYIKNSDPREIVLSRLIDIVLLIKKTKLKIYQVEMISQKYDILEQILYTLGMIKKFFPNILDNEYLEFIEKHHSDYNLDIYMTIDGLIKEWPISVFDRAFYLQKKMQAIKEMNL